MEWIAILVIILAGLGGLALAAFAIWQISWYLCGDIISHKMKIIAKRKNPSN